jgi:MerR family copper efflux transcriptional regulator
MRIGELAGRAGTRPRTIRFYERIGVLPLPRRADNGYRDYDDTILERLAFIHAAQASGFTLAEIRSIIAVRDNGEAPCAHVQALIERHVEDVDRRLDELRRLRGELARLADRARRFDPADCGRESVCRIITG